MALETRVVMAGPEDKVRFEVDRDDATFVVDDVRLINEFADQTWRVTVTDTRTGFTRSLTAGPNSIAVPGNAVRNAIRQRQAKVAFSREATTLTVGEREANLAIELTRIDL